MTQAAKAGGGEEEKEAAARAVRSGFMGSSFRFYSHTEPHSHRDVGLFNGLPFWGSSKFKDESSTWQEDVNPDD